MRRTGIAFAVVVIAAVASIVWAQAPVPATLRAPAGDRPIAVLQQDGHTLVAVDEVAAALGGSVVPDNQGFRIRFGNHEAAISPESRFGVLRDELIEMPVPPLSVDGRAFVPWQFFHGLLRITSELDVSWDGTAKVLLFKPVQREVLAANVSLIVVGEISKLLIQLPAPSEYVVVREDASYVVRFKNPIRGTFTDQSFDNPHVTRIAIGTTEMRIFLRSRDVAGDAYRLDNPFRVAIDFRAGVAPVTAPGILPLNPDAVERRGIRTIVLDPGHGGKEVGAVGANGLVEKDLTLSLSRQLAAALGSRLDIRVILTRTSDEQVSLEQRTALANQYKADLFLSIHLNAAPIRNAKGAETYFLSLEASDELARRAAERENDLSATQQTSTSASDLRLILWDLAHQQYVKESSRLAGLIQQEMNRASGITDRGVKQAPFKVLIGATMPAALIEIGFVSNPEEEARLQTDAFQAEIVNALVAAVTRYKTEYETRIGLIKPSQTPPPAAAASPAPAQQPAPKQPGR